MPPKRPNLGRHHYETQRKRVARPDQVNNNVIIWHRAAFAYDRLKNYFSDAKVSISEMSKNCQYCNAKRWPSEAPGMCCSGGKVTLSKLHNLPQFFCNLLTDDTVAAFRKNLLKYNASFIMTSFGADRDCTNKVFFYYL